MKKFFDRILSIFRSGESVPKMSTEIIRIPSFKMKDIVNEAVMPVLQKHQCEKTMIFAKDEMSALRNAMQEQGHSSMAQMTDQLIEKGYKLILIETKDGYSAFGLSAEDTFQDEMPHGGVVFCSGECIQYDVAGNERRSLIKIDKTKRAEKKKEEEKRDQAKGVWGLVYSLLSTPPWKSQPERSFKIEEIVVENFRTLVVCPTVSEALRKGKKWVKAVIMLPEEADNFLDAMKQTRPELVSEIKQYLSDGQKQLVLFMDQEGNAAPHFLKAREPQTSADMLSMVVFPSGEYQNYKETKGN